MRLQLNCTLFLVDLLWASAEMVYARGDVGMKCGFCIIFPNFQVPTCLHAETIELGANVILLSSDEEEISATVAKLLAY